MKGLIDPGFSIYEDGPLPRHRQTARVIDSSAIFQEMNRIKTNDGSDHGFVKEPANRVQGGAKKLHRLPVGIGFNTKRQGFEDKSE